MHVHIESLADLLFSPMHERLQIGRQPHNLYVSIFATHQAQHTTINLRKRKIIQLSCNITSFATKSDSTDDGAAAKSACIKQYNNNSAG
jgi:hypothetical protein